MAVQFAQPVNGFGLRISGGIAEHPEHIFAVRCSRQVMKLHVLKDLVVHMRIHTQRFWRGAEDSESDVDLPVRVRIQLLITAQRSAQPFLQVGLRLLFRRLFVVIRFESNAAAGGEYATDKRRHFLLVPCNEWGVRPA